MPLIPQSDAQFDALDTKTPYLQIFDGTDVGQMAHWIGRWVNTRGDQGPWSDTVSATVVG